MKCTIYLMFTRRISSGQYEVIVFVPLITFKNGSAFVFSNIRLGRLMRKESGS